MFDNPLAQALGLLSYLLGVLCFYQKDDRKLKIIMVVMNINNAIHFTLLGAPSAAVGSSVSAVRTWLAVYISSRYLAVVFISITLVAGAYCSDSIQDIFPILGTCIGTFAIFCLKGIKMRIAFLCGALCWLTNNILVGSIGGTLLELTLLTVNATTIRRLLATPSPAY